MPGTENCSMVQRRKEAPKPLPHSKAQEKKETEEVNLVNVLNPGNPELVAGGVFAPPPPSRTAPEVETREPRAPPLCGEGWVSPSKTRQGTQFGKGASLSRGSQFPLRQYPTGGVNQEGQPAGYNWEHTPFSTQAY